MVSPAPADIFAGLPVGPDQVRAARTLLAPVIRQTPLTASRPLAERVGGPVWLKCENLQRAGSFKIRGAYTRLAGLSPAQRARGVVAASAGNHAQGVALAARLLGVSATVFMPLGAPIPKVAATRGYGAAVQFAGQSVDEALVAAEEYAARTGAVLIHPFDHADIVAGQGTVGLEILEQCPDVATILVGTGGGGLLAGISLSVADARPDVRVIGVQAAAAAAYPGSLAAGRPVPLATMATMADGIAVGRPGAVPFAVVSTLGNPVLTVSEESLSTAVLLLLERSKMLVEPAGAAGVAALFEHPEAVRPPVVSVLSGGNVDPLLLWRLLAHGMAAAGRYLSLRVRVADRPGALATLLAALAASDANVVEVEHRRTDPRLRVDEVEISVQVETRGPAHAEQVAAALGRAGYAPALDSTASSSG